MAKLLLATKNPGKAEELRSLLAGLPDLQLIMPEELGICLQVKETGASYAENAGIKARAFAKASGLTCLADDSGLEVEALNGAPGLYSARYAPQADASDADRRRHLLAQLSEKPRPWTARFHSTVCVARPDSASMLAEGECRGEIIPEERGSNGFGYDPIFLVEGLGLTMAELSLVEKNRLSHRARAVMTLRNELRALD